MPNKLLKMDWKIRSFAAHLTAAFLLHFLYPAFNRFFYLPECFYLIVIKFEKDCFLCKMHL